MRVLSEDRLPFKECYFFHADSLVLSNNNTTHFVVCCRTVYPRRYSLESLQAYLVSFSPKIIPVNLLFMIYCSFEPEQIISFGNNTFHVFLYFWGSILLFYLLGNYLQSFFSLAFLEHLLYISTWAGPCHVCGNKYNIVAAL